MARLSGIVEESIVDGPGLRFVVFFQGCPHRCRGCHNPETHDFCKGYKKPVSKIMKDLFKNPLLSGLTLSGGEPFAQAESAYMLAKYAHDMSLDTITYTGFLFEELLEKFSQIPFCAKLLRETDTLIDGPFILEKRTLSLRFRGSKNQRIIDPKLSLERGVVVEKDF
ncbi:MAG: anaerobic ribonucleoside-triphosphate reductase activating protein [Oscillospiraceae bacterium]|jgi:anaerobic ribonucleoside-triphosphate reductase activating protein|nr:anaerobic ribonucleoside-triphosphate reductase activating protein [Oscillospiraceae bacterium]